MRGHPMLHAPDVRLWIPLVGPGERLLGDERCRRAHRWGNVPVDNVGQEKSLPFPHVLPHTLDAAKQDQAKVREETQSNIYFQSKCGREPSSSVE